MKRIGNIYSKIYDLDNLRLAHKMARKDKKLYREVQMVDENEEYYLLKIQKMLKDKLYHIDKYDYKVTTIRDRTKSRELWKLSYYPHRIIQRAIMLQLEKVFMQVFTNFTCASVGGRGSKRVMNLMDKYMKDKEGTKYCLKLDIQKFYPNINHRILKRLLRKKIKDKDLLELLDKIIDSYPGRKGVPIGSYLSQYLANYYLAYFDHYVKEQLKCKYVIRYMDDIVILGSSKSNLRYVLRSIEKYLSGTLCLSLKHNYQIFSTNVRGVDFVGYRYFNGFRLLRKRTCKRMKNRALKYKNTFKDWCAINSYIGRMKHCNSYRLKQKYIKPLCDKLIEYYKTFINKTKMSYANKLLFNIANHKINLIY